MGANGSALRLTVTVGAVVAFSIGCAAGPPRGRGPMREPDGPSEPREEDLPGAATLLVGGIVVDVDQERSTIVVKEDRTYATWTVAVTSESRIIGSDAGIISLPDLKIGDRVQIRGQSRIEGILTALEVNVSGGDR